MTLSDTPALGLLNSAKVATERYYLTKAVGPRNLTYRG